MGRGILVKYWTGSGKAGLCSMMVENFVSPEYLTISRSLYMMLWESHQ